MKAAILTDTTKCIGCNQCSIACKRANHLAPDVPRRWDLEDGLSARNWTSVVQGPDHSFVRKQCRHCLEPACVSVCPVGALTKTALGPVVYDSQKCMGCRYCMMACPYSIPRYDWDQTTPYVRKCILCYGRIREGKLPACIEACPTKATIFGDREALLAEAHRRIAENPGVYWGQVGRGRDWRDFRAVHLQCRSVLPDGRPSTQQGPAARAHGSGHARGPLRLHRRCGGHGRLELDH